MDSRRGCLFFGGLLVVAILIFGIGIDIGSHHHGNASSNGSSIPSLGQVEQSVSNDLGGGTGSTTPTPASTVNYAAGEPTPAPKPTPTPLPGIGKQIFAQGGHLGVKLTGVDFYDDSSDHDGAFTAHFVITNTGSQPALVSLNWNGWYATDSMGTEYWYIGNQDKTTHDTDLCGMRIFLAPPGSGSNPISTVTLAPGQNGDADVTFAHCSNNKQRITPGATYVRIWNENLVGIVKPTFFAWIPR